MTRIEWVVWREIEVGTIKARNADEAYTKAILLFPGVTRVVTRDTRDSVYVVYGTDLAGTVTAPSIAAAYRIAQAKWASVVKVQSQVSYHESLAADHVLAQRHIPKYLSSGD